MDQTLETLRSTLGDRYRVEKAVGRGGMATVYLAQDLRHDRKVAIKVLRPDLTATVGADRFTREVKIAAQLSHPNILGVFDSGETQGLLYYVMPFVEGESLRDKLNREQQLSIDEAIQITCEVAEALGYAHAHDIVHRDVKPENILLQSGRALVADFGIARLAEAGAEKLTATGMAVGTAAYMSPEQASGMPTDQRADIYALGCTLYEMLAGQPPFVGTNAMQIMSQHHLATVPEIRVMRHAVPEELDAVIRRAMEKAPADRFQSMEEFKRAALGEIPATTATVSRYTARYRTRTPGRREGRWRDWLIVGVVMLGIAAAGAVLAQKFTGGDAAADANRVAVLYFEDETGGAMRHVADGLTESLIDRLEDVAALSVVPASGVRELRGRSVSSDSIRAEFGIGTIVKGSVAREGARAKVTINVVDAASDASYDRKAISVDTTQLVALQGMVADEVSRFLREAIGGEVRLKADREETRSTAAWTLAERAGKLRKDADSLMAVNAMDEARLALARADSLLGAATVADPAWARLPAARAGNDVLRAQLLGRKSPAQRAMLDSGLALADAAIAVQANNADALEAKGRALYMKYALAFEPDPAANNRLLAAAESTLIKATEVDRGHAGAWVALSNLYYLKPNIAAANRAATAAYAADAYLASANGILRRLFWTSHDLEMYPEALDWCTRGSRRFPADPFFTECRLWMYTTRAAGRPDIDSVWQYQAKFVALNDAAARPYADKYSRILVAGALARRGDREEARRLLLEARATPEVDPNRELVGNEAVIRVILGDYDEAVNLLEKYLDMHPDHRRGFATRVSPWWRDLQSNPRFKRIVATAR
jgi:serine/threonine-protein kinase